MVLCAIIYDPAGGSDTAASGSNAPSLAHTDVTLGATVSGTASTTTMTFSSTINLTGVNDDGTDVIWVAGTAGERHLFRITAFTGGVATCTGLTVVEAIGGSGLSASSWAIGGKRQGLENDTTNTDLEDAQAGWEYRLEGGTYPTTVAHNLPPVGNIPDGPIRIVRASGTPDIHWTTIISPLTLGVGSKLYIEGITMTTSVVSHPSARAISTTSTNNCVTAVDCTFDCSGEAVYIGGGYRVCLRGCKIRSQNSDGVFITYGRCIFHAINCTFHDCDDHGFISTSGSGLEFVAFISCIFSKNGTATDDSGLVFPISTTGMYGLLVLNCVFHGNHHDGIQLTGSPNENAGPVTLFNNIFTENGRYGINAVAGAPGDDLIVQNNYNFFHNNTSGEVNNVTKGPDSVSIGADPYTDVGALDFSLNNLNPGGALVRDAGYGHDGDAS